MEYERSKLERRTKMEREIGKIFGNNIRNLRESHGLSEKEMAKRVGISAAELSKLESGIIPPHIMLDLLFVIEREFGVKVHKLLL